MHGLDICKSWYLSGQYEGSFSIFLHIKTLVDCSSALSEISFSGRPSKGKRPSIRKHSVVITAICREIFSKYFFRQYFCELLENSSYASKYVVKSDISKVAGFYRSNHRMLSVKNVFLERCLLNSQETACVRESNLIKLHS